MPVRIVAAAGLRLSSPDHQETPKVSFLKSRRWKHRFLIGAAIGTGMAANFAIRGGADFLVALSAGRLRSMGEPSVASTLALTETNAFVMNFAAREILPRSTVPVIFGACVFDPRQDISRIVDEVCAAGFDGITNFPTASLFGGPLRCALEKEGLGYAREMKMLRLAKEAGLATIAYTHSVPEVEAAAKTGVDIVVCGLGWNYGGALAPLADSHVLGIEEAAIYIERAARAARSTGALCLVEGGPIISPLHLKNLCRLVNVDGYVGGSTIDRVPLETAIEEITASFKNIRSMDAPTGADADNTTFPVQLAGGSEGIREARQSILRLAAGEGSVHICVPGLAGTGPVAEIFHRLSPQRTREPIILNLGLQDAEAPRRELFGTFDTRRKIGLLEIASGRTLIIDCAPGTAPDLVREVAETVRRGYARPIGSERTYPVNVRLIVASAKDVSPVPGLTFISIPKLADRSEDVGSVLGHVLRKLQSLLRKPMLRLDAAAWRMLVNHDWPGDIDELWRVVENAALAAQGDVVTPVELGNISGYSSGRRLFASEKEWILDGLRRNSFHKGRTAEWLGISRKTLYNKVRRYALDLDSST